MRALPCVPGLFPLYRVKEVGKVIAYNKNRIIFLLLPQKFSSSLEQENLGWLEMDREGEMEQMAWCTFKISLLCPPGDGPCRCCQGAWGQKRLWGCSEPVPQSIPGECWALCCIYSRPAAQSGLKFTLPTCTGLSSHLHLPGCGGTSLALLTIPR